jgi:hypothetical protein
MMDYSQDRLNNWKKFVQDNFRTGSGDQGYEALVVNINEKPGFDKEEPFITALAICKQDESDLEYKWYNLEGKPLSYHDFRDSNNNICDHSGTVSHWIDPKDAGKLMFKAFGESNAKEKE